MPLHDCGNLPTPLYSNTSTHTFHRKIVADMSPHKHEITLFNYSATLQAMEQGVSASYVHADMTAWGKCTKFTDWIGVRYDLREPVTILQIFPHWVRTCLLSASGHYIWKRLIEQYLHSVGQIFTSEGDLHPRMDMLVNIGFWLQCHLSRYKNKDHTQTSVHSIPLYLLLHLHLI